MNHLKHEIIKSYFFCFLFLFCFQNNETDKRKQQHEKIFHEINYYNLNNYNNINKLRKTF